eukprot:6490487-Amphidinium_carterae.2
MDVCIDTLSNALSAFRGCHLFQHSCISTSRCIVAGLLTGFGLDLLAGLLSGPTVDHATLQLVGVLFSSILMPGLAWALEEQEEKICKLKKERRNAPMNIAS